MSKPVTNVEIEDVLSSIRRLVTSSDRVERPEPETPDNVGDKLVLTPSLRVDSPEIEVENTYEKQSSEDDTSSEDVRGSQAVEELESAEEDTALDEFNAAAEEEFLNLSPQEPTADHDDESPEEAVADVLDSDGDGANDFSAVTDALAANEDDVSVAEILGQESDNSNKLPSDQADLAERASDRWDDADPGGDGDNLQRRAAEFEAIVAEKEDLWDPDGTTQDENAAVSGGPVPWNDNDEEDDAPVIRDEIDELTELAAETDVEDVDVDEGEVTEDSRAEMPEPLAVAEVAEEPVETQQDAEPIILESAFRQNPDAESGDVEIEEGDGNDGEEAEAAPFVFRSQARSESVSSDTQDNDAPLKIEEALLDEEALRDLVSEIVRQELQGALGERITRNVRKLVRREIHRALACQELE